MDNYPRWLLHNHWTFCCVQWPKSRRCHNFPVRFHSTPYRAWLAHWTGRQSRTQVGKPPPKGLGWGWMELRLLYSVRSLMWHESHSRKKTVAVETKVLETLLMALGIVNRTELPLLSKVEIQIHIKRCSPPTCDPRYCPCQVECHISNCSAYMHGFC